MQVVQFARYGGPEVLQLTDVPDPVPGSDDVLIEVKATTVNHLDLFQRDGSRPVNRLPFTPGLEAAGIVIHDSNGFHAGERVLTTLALLGKGGGGYAGKMAVPASLLVRIPDGVTFEQAAATGLTSSTAWGALFDLGHLKAGERVLIWAGSSGVGSIAIQFAKHAGCWVATTAGSKDKAEQLRNLGADMVVNHKEENVGQAIQKAGGVNLVIELVSTTLQASIDACVNDGRVVLIGNLGGQQATVDTQAWRLKRVVVIGGGQLRTSPANEERILQLVAEKAITPVIARTMPVEQAAEAHRILASGEPIGKIVLVHT
ncbi:MAG TPA: zinc-binding dehydrogenase [Ktedonobacteraceae bacterium]|nr:zinc-binding dehydrogenase [Ktedonobacteraceae bacterium]